jgi:hypothetical protein
MREGTRYVPKPFPTSKARGIARPFRIQQVPVAQSGPHVRAIELEVPLSEPQIHRVRGEHAQEAPRVLQPTCEDLVLGSGAERANCPVRQEKIQRCIAMIVHVIASQRSIHHDQARMVGGIDHTVGRNGFPERLLPTQEARDGLAATLLNVGILTIEERRYLHSYSRCNIAWPFARVDRGLHLTMRNVVVSLTPGDIGASRRQRHELRGRPAGT